MAKKKDKKMNPGQVILPVGNPNPPELHEIEAAWILARHYGCTIEFLIPVDDYKRKTPDTVMFGVEWEIKSPIGRGRNTIRHQFGRASSQARNIVFDGRRTKINDDSLQKGILRELKEHRSIQRVIFISKSQNVLEITPQK
jgi:hypothetical protein